MTPLAPAFPVDVVSDVHLNVRDPHTLALFLKFLSADKPQAKTLIILGDLFDAWIGDDAVDETGQAVANALRHRHDQGTEIYFVPGNRDFLIGEAYCAQAGMKCLDEPIVLAGTDRPTALIHGDRLCTDDHAYQRFRKKTQNPRWRARVLRWPVWLRRLLRGWARHQSKRHGSAQIKHRPAIMDVNNQAVDRFATHHGIQRLIHGHTHRLGIHPEHTPSTPERWVLGDWQAGGGSYLRITPTGCSLYALSTQPQSTPPASIDPSTELIQEAIEPPQGH